MSYGVIYKKGHPKTVAARVYTDASSDFTCCKSSAALVVLFDKHVYKASYEVDFDPNVAVCEAEAIVLALKFCEHIDTDNLLMYTDCETLVRCIYKPTGKEPDNLKRQIKNIKKACKAYSQVSLAIVGRFITEEAHMLAIEKLREIR